MDLNLLQTIIEEPRIRKYANPKITRAGLSSNPVERFSFTGGTVFNNDQLVKHGGAFFVGGDTATYEYDMSLKIAGSVAECPMRIYSTYDTTPSTIPTSGTWGDGYVGTQSSIDKLKTMDGTLQGSLTDSTSNTGMYRELMVELDLTPLCNGMFGGSNSALKSALKAINVDCYAMGSGSNAGVSANGVAMQWWNATTSAWVSTNSNATGSIAKISLSSNNNAYVGSNNKFYVLVNAQYASDGTIASSVSLDYINIKVDIARTIDTVQPITVNLPKYWAMCVKGFSQNWDSTSKSRVLFELIKGTDTSNRFYVNLASNNNIQFFKLINGASAVTAYYNSSGYTKYKVMSAIFGQSVSGLFMKLLFNNGTMVSGSANTDTNILNGLMNLRTLAMGSTGYESDAFAESFNLVDLTRLGKPNGFTDAEATAILQGVLPNPLGIQNPELFDITKVSLDSHVTLNNGVITLNATGAYQSSTIEIPVFPNNRYELNFNKTGARGYIDIVEKYNTSTVKSTWNVGINVEGKITYALVTTANTSKIKFTISNDTTTGTFTFSNISLKRKD